MKVWPTKYKEKCSKTVRRKKNTDYIKGNINEIVNFLQVTVNAETNGIILAKS